MPGRNGILAAILVVMIGIVGGAAHATVAGIPGHPGFGAALSEAAQALDELDLDIPEGVAERDVLLLALNVYFEARGEGIIGKSAVAHVTLNRMKDGRFPSAMDEVILQPGQFSWTRKLPKIADREALQVSLVVAAKALTGTLRDRTGGALYFHAARLGKPSWTRGLNQIAQIGAHTFYSD